MVHAADTGDGIANTGCDTGAKQRHEHDIRIVGDEIFALDDVHLSVTIVPACLRLERLRPVHLRRPNTASIAPFSAGIVNGLTR